MYTEEYNMPGVSISDAAKRMGVTATAVSQMCHKETIPSEKVGSKRFIEESIVVAVIELKKEYGKRWSKHAPWNGGEAAAKAVEVAVNEDEQESLNIYQKLHKAAKDAIDDRDPDKACEFYEILLSSIDLSAM